METVTLSYLSNLVNTIARQPNNSEMKTIAIFLILVSLPNLSMTNRHLDHRLKRHYIPYQEPAPGATETFREVQGNLL